MTVTTKALSITAIEAFQALAYEPYVLFLDSADTHHPDGRYAFVMCDPVEIISSNFDRLQERLALYPKYETIPDLPPFQGGAAGLFSYDLGRSLENLPNIAKPTTIPDMFVGIYDQVLAFDLRAGKGWLISHADEDKQQALLDKLGCHPEAQPKDLRHGSFASLKMTTFEPDVPPDQYKANIGRVINYIKDGDIFQANLAQRFSAPIPANFDPAAHYLKLRAHNPAPFAAYMNLGNVQISSASPERFLHISGSHVTTCPIKGTRPVCVDADENTRQMNELISSEKDRAENIMIVDLLRNDLSKTCTAKSIKVPELCKLESFASVHHLVSTITGELAPDKTPLDVLKHCFPGGSITGAPKIRAMEIIEELEPTRRGAYCGSIGYIGFDGAMDSNILIRTLSFEQGTVSFGAGGGITASSNIEAEYNESLDKAKAIFESFY